MDSGRYVFLRHLRHYARSNGCLGKCCSSKHAVEHEPGGRERKLQCREQRVHLTVCAQCVKHLERGHLCGRTQCERGASQLRGLGRSYNGHGELHDYQREHPPEPNHLAANGDLPGKFYRNYFVLGSEFGIAPGEFKGHGQWPASGHWSGGSSDHWQLEFAQPDLYRARQRDLRHCPAGGRCSGFWQ